MASHHSRRIIRAKHDILPLKGPESSREPQPRREGHVMWDWKAQLGMFASIAQIIAIVVGGVWVYFNFIRRRTFNRRGELNVDLSVVEGAHHRLVQVTILFENTGLAVIRLHPVVKFCRVFALTDQEIAADVNVNWGKQLIVSPAFSEHHWVEGQETISDQLIIPVPSHLQGSPVVAYKVATLVTAKRGILVRNTVVWTNISIIAPEPRSPLRPSAQATAE
jgi:hypothetical protein